MDQYLNIVKKRLHTTFTKPRKGIEMFYNDGVHIYVEYERDFGSFIYSYKVTQK